MTLYLDASVIVPLVVIEPKSKIMLAWLDARIEPMHVAQLAVAEVGSAISRRRRMRELTDEDGERALAMLDNWLPTATTIVAHEPSDIVEAGRLVRRPLPKLLTPDAIHLATCRRLGLSLVTADEDLAKVADLLGIDWAMPA